MFKSEKALEIMPCIWNDWLPKAISDEIKHGMFVVIAVVVMPDILTETCEDVQRSQRGLPG